MVGAATAMVVDERSGRMDVESKPECARSCCLSGRFAEFRHESAAERREFGASSDLVLDVHHQLDRALQYSVLSFTFQMSPFFVRKSPKGILLWFNRFVAPSARFNKATSR